MEYKIDENTYYGITDKSGGLLKHQEYIKYQRENGQDLTVSFASRSDSTEDGSYSAPYFMVEVALSKPETEVKKTTNFLRNILSRKPKQQEADSISQEVLFRKSFPCYRDIEDNEYHSDLNLFLKNPIKLDKEYQTISELVEKARKTILTTGREAWKKSIQERRQQKALQAQIAETQASQQRTEIDKIVAKKINECRD